MANTENSIAGAYAEQPLSAAARLALADRLSVVVETLPFAAERAFEDTEHVHKLRVATRRSAAALAFFKPCLPGKVRRPIKKILRELRRACGEARNLDVLAEQLARVALPNSVGSNSSQFSPLLFQLVMDRVEAQKHLLAARDKVIQGSAWKMVLEIHERAAWQGANAKEPVLAEHARTILLSELREVREASAEDLENLTQLHGLRVALKRLRYSMELGSCVLSPEILKARWTLVRGLQDRLGKINDHHTFAGIFSAWKRFSPLASVREAAGSMEQVQLAVVKELHQSLLQTLAADITAPLQEMETELKAFSQAVLRS